HVFLCHELVEQLLDARVLGTERLLEPGAEGFQVEEVEIEDAVEGRQIARLFHERGRERGLERVPVLEADFRGRRQRVHGLAGRNAQLRAPEIAYELQYPLVHLYCLNVKDIGQAVGPLRASGPHRGARPTVRLYRPGGHRVKVTQEDLKTSSPPSRVM